MNVIKKKTLDGYALRHADAAMPLASWRKIFENTDFADINAIRAVLPTADFVDPYTIFNIKGNNYRLVVAVHYDKKRMFIRFVGTHSEYNRINAETV